MKHALLPVVGLIGVVVGGACSGAKDQFGGDGGGAPVSCAVLDAGDATKDYGTISVGDQGPPVPITVTNTGSCPSAVLATAIAGQDADSFVADTDACKGQALQPGSSCIISTHFGPSSSGAKTATLTVAGAPGEAASVALTGTGGPITLLPTMQDYGTVVVGHKSVPTTFTLTNGGSAPTGIVKMDVLGGDQEQFLMQNDHCSGVALAPTKSCSVDVTFTAAGNGDKAAKLTATIAGVATARSTLRGLVAGGAAFDVTPPTYDFGSVTAKTMTAPTSFVIRNKGEVASGVPSVAGSDPGCPHFTIANACKDGLPSKGSCRFTVLYAPPAPTTSSETCNLNVTAPETISGIAKVVGLGLTPAALQSNPLSHDFGNVLQGSTSADFTFVITNTGMSTTTALAVSVSGTNASQFGLGPNTCADKQLNGMGTCSVAVHFSPNANSFGRVQAQLLVQSTVGGIDSIGVSGTASTPPILAIGPDSNGFGAHEIGTASSAFTFTVTNSGSLPSGPPKVTLSGSGDFVKGKDTCSTFPIPGMDGFCTVDVIYKAAAHGFVTGMLTVSANPGGTVSSTVSGTGVKPPQLQITGPGDFGNVIVHTTSGTNTFTVRNNGETPSGGLQGAFINGPNAGDFHITGDNCHGQQLGGNGANTCTVSVNFTPSNANFEQATLNENDGQGAGAGVGLRGTGICIPNCNNQACGAGDGCGGQCGNGFCPNGQTCGGGGAKNVCGCTPNCNNKPCGAGDGCGGQCGNGFCPNDQKCVANACCTRDCTNKCGGVSDGCGGKCNAACCMPLKVCPPPDNCGKIPDGCGGTVNCGTCSGTNTCGGGTPSVPNVCGCTPLKACPAGDVCGTIPDGCGGKVNCGSCPANSTCSADNTTCTTVCPTTCPTGDNCGTFTPPIAGCPTLTCGPTNGTCPAGQTCGGGNPGTPNVCGCNPIKACPMGDNCGTISDGCGGTINCGMCATGQTCGGGNPGSPNVCGCTKATGCPAPENCGTIPDGCGGTVTCAPNMCPANTTCGGGGVGNVCGCKPATACPTGQICGMASDGCGGMINCGSCPSGDSCSTDGKTCSLTCSATCPAGDNCGTYTAPGCQPIDCGTCPTGQTCGAGNPGVPNVCGCNKLTGCPSPDNCGTISDNCGGTINCGTCSGTNTCGGGTPSVPNVCGCTPLKACPTPNNCGTMADGCGGMINCGTCMNSQMCQGTICVPNPVPEGGSP